MESSKIQKGIFKSITRVLAASLFFGIFVYINYTWIYEKLGEQHIMAFNIVTQMCMVVALVAVAIQIVFTTKFMTDNKNVHMGALFFTISLFQVVQVMTYEGMPYDQYAELSLLADLLTHNLLPLGMIIIFSIYYRKVSKVYRKNIFGVSIILAIAFLGLCVWQIEWITAFVGSRFVVQALQISALCIQVLLLVLLVIFLKLSRLKNILFLNAASYFLVGNILYSLSSKQTDAFHILGELGQLIAFVALFHAIYHSLVEKPYMKLEKSEMRMQKMAYYDEELGLPNYHYLEEYAQKAFTRVKGEQALLLIEIDQMSKLKATFGQQATVKLMQAMADRWQRVLDDALLTRFSRHQFLIYVENYTPERVSNIMKRLQQSVEEPIQLMHVSWVMRFVAGAAVFPKHAGNLDDLLQCVHLALNEAKKHGTEYEEFAVEIERENRERVQLEYDLEKAIPNGEFFLEYQPQMELVSRDLPSVEALVRWRHPKHGTISPVRFIPVAEETGLIIPLGIWVLKKACQEIKYWQRVHQKPLKVAVNLSLNQLYTKNFVADVKAVLEETQLEAKYLQLEITESVTSEATQIIPILTDLKKMGIGIAIDDFGTGYSSLAYLTDLPIDCLKIDRSFVNKIGISDKGEAIVTTILAMAENLHLKVVAEGIETLEQLRYLERAGCHNIQGYYISRPIPFQQLLETYDDLKQRADEVLSI